MEDYVKVDEYNAARNCKKYLISYKDAVQIEGAPNLAPNNVKEIGFFLFGVLKTVYPYLQDASLLGIGIEPDTMCYYLILSHFAWEEVERGGCVPTVFPNLLSQLKGEERE